MDKKTQNSTSQWLTPVQAAAHIKCSPAFLSKDRIAGLHGIPFSRMGRHIRYSVSELDAWMESNKVQSENRK